MKNKLLLGVLFVSITAQTQTGVFSWTKDKIQAAGIWAADKTKKATLWANNNYEDIKISVALLGLSIATSAVLLYGIERNKDIKTAIANALATVKDPEDFKKVSNIINNL